MNIFGHIGFNSSNLENIKNGECYFWDNGSEKIPFYKKNNKFYHYFNIKEEIYPTDNILEPVFIGSDQTFKISINEISLNYWIQKTEPFYAKLELFYNDLWCISEIKLPQKGDWCTHYNVLSRILEVGPLLNKEKMIYSLKLESFFTDGIMIHSSSIYQLIELNQNELLNKLIQLKNESI